MKRLPFLLRFLSLWLILCLSLPNPAFALRQLNAGSEEGTVDDALTAALTGTEEAPLIGRFSGRRQLLGAGAGAVASGLLGWGGKRLANHLTDEPKTTPPPWDLLASKKWRAPLEAELAKLWEEGRANTPRQRELQSQLEEMGGRQFREWTGDPEFGAPNQVLNLIKKVVPDSPWQEELRFGVPQEITGGEVRRAAVVSNFLRNGASVDEVELRKKGILSPTKGLRLAFAPEKDAGELVIRVPLSLHSGKPFKTSEFDTATVSLQTSKAVRDWIMSVQARLIPEVPVDNPELTGWTGKSVIGWKEWNAGNVRRAQIDIDFGPLVADVRQTYGSVTELELRLVLDGSAGPLDLDFSGGVNSSLEYALAKKALTSVNTREGLGTTAAIGLPALAGGLLGWWLTRTRTPPAPQPSASGAEERDLGVLAASELPSAIARAVLGVTARALGQTGSIEGPVQVLLVNESTARSQSHVLELEVPRFLAVKPPSFWETEIREKLKLVRVEPSSENWALFMEPPSPRFVDEPQLSFRLRPAAPRAAGAEETPPGEWKPDEKIKKKISALWKLALRLAEAWMDHKNQDSSPTLPVMARSLVESDSALAPLMKEAGLTIQDVYRLYFNTEQPPAALVPSPKQEFLYALAYLFFGALRDRYQRGLSVSDEELFSDMIDSEPALVQQAFRKTPDIEFDRWEGLAFIRRAKQIVGLSAAGTEESRRSFLRTAGILLGAPILSNLLVAAPVPYESLFPWVPKVDLPKELQSQKGIDVGRGRLSTIDEALDAIKTDPTLRVIRLYPKKEGYVIPRNRFIQLPKGVSLVGMVPGKVSVESEDWGDYAFVLGGGQNVIAGIDLKGYCDLDGEGSQLLNNRISGGVTVRGDAHRIEGNTIFGITPITKPAVLMLGPVIRVGAPHFKKSVANNLIRGNLVVVPPIHEGSPANKEIEEKGRSAIQFYSSSGNRVIGNTFVQLDAFQPAVMHGPWHFVGQEPLEKKDAVAKGNILESNVIVARSLSEKKFPMNAVMSFEPKDLISRNNLIRGRAKPSALDKTDSFDPNVGVLSGGDLLDLWKRERWTDPDYYRIIKASLPKGLPPVGVFRQSQKSGTEEPGGTRRWALGRIVSGGLGALFGGLGGGFAGRLR